MDRRDGSCVLSYVYITVCEDYRERKQHVGEKGGEKVRDKKEKRPLP
jgi:hypothetical protein